MTVTTERIPNIAPAQPLDPAETVVIAAPEAEFTSPQPPAQVELPIDPQPITSPIEATPDGVVVEPYTGGVSMVSRFIGRMLVKDYKPGGTIVGKTLAWGQMKIQNVPERLAGLQGAKDRVMGKVIASNDAEKYRLHGLTPKQIGVVAGAYAVAGAMTYLNLKSAGAMPHVSADYLPKGSGHKPIKLPTMNLTDAHTVATETPLQLPAESATSLQLHDHVLTLHEGATQTNLNLSGLHKHTLTLKGNVLNIKGNNGFNIEIGPQDIGPKGTLSEHVTRQLEARGIKLGSADVHPGISAPVQTTSETIKYVGGNSQGLSIDHGPHGDLVISMHVQHPGASNPGQIIITGTGPNGQTTSTVLPMKDGHAVVGAHTDLWKDIKNGKVTVRGGQIGPDGVIHSSATIPATHAGPNILDGSHQGQSVEVKGSATTYTVSDTTNSTVKPKGRGSWGLPHDPSGWWALSEHARHEAMDQAGRHERVLDFMGAAASYIGLVTTASVFQVPERVAAATLPVLAKLPLIGKRIPEEALHIDEDAGEKKAVIKNRTVAEALKKHFGPRELVPLLMISGMVMSTEIREAALYVHNLDWASAVKWTGWDWGKMPGRISNTKVASQAKLGIEAAALLAANTGIAAGWIRRKRAGIPIDQEQAGQTILEGITSPAIPAAVIGTGLLYATFSEKLAEGGSGVGLYAGSLLLGASLGLEAVKNIKPVGSGERRERLREAAEYAATPVAENLKEYTNERVSREVLTRALTEVIDLPRRPLWEKVIPQIGVITPDFFVKRLGFSPMLAGEVWAILDGTGVLDADGRYRHPFYHATGTTDKTSSPTLSSV
ncbi:MAG TPA: hypothetical protein VLH38_04560 [Patescibacteria group bacterium]|nr:hypothetical protein [Patescibacteria group bacterium]